MSGGAVELIELRKRFGDVTAVDGIDLTIRAGEFFSLLGPSGCGKTTTLRLIAGFERPDEGRILLDGADMASTPPHKRRVNTVFQSYALFPHLSVFDNVAFGLRRRHDPRGEIARKVEAVLEAVRLEGLEKRRPVQLSGGQQQRVALARALVLNPAVLLLDEPLGALDAKLRKALQLELKAIQEQFGVTFVYVTHDQEEALTMSDRVAVMRAGRIEQIGAPREIYETPRTVFVAGFIGNTNLLVGRSRSDAAVECAGLTIATAGAAPTAGAAVTVAVRPERIRLDDTAALDNQVAATVAHVVYQGETVRYLLAAEGGLELQAVELGRVRFPAGARVRAGWAAADARVLTS